tara:strand:+ start:40 stop:510 length:471 start_codon:yes stop_codon:yes gene_type:complete
MPNSNHQRPAGTIKKLSDQIEELQKRVAQLSNKVELYTNESRTVSFNKELLNRNRLLQECLKNTKKLKNMDVDRWLNETHKDIENWLEEERKSIITIKEIRAKFIIIEKFHEYIQLKNLEAEYREWERGKITNSQIAEATNKKSSGQHTLKDNLTF